MKNLVKSLLFALVLSSLSLAAILTAESFILKGGEQTSLAQEDVSLASTNKEPPSIVEQRVEKRADAPEALDFVNPGEEEESSLLELKEDGSLVPVQEVPSAQSQTTAEVTILPN
jgi:hypothetical protein